MNDQPEPDEISDDEQALLGELGRALPADPLPDGLIDRAVGLIDWFDIDAELASLLDRPADQLAGVRGDTTATSIGTFATEDGDVELVVEIEANGVERTLVGFVARGEITSAVLLDVPGDDIARTDTDEFGRFEIDVAVDARGPHRLRVLAPHRTVVTDWFVL